MRYNETLPENVPVTERVQITSIPCFIFCFSDAAFFSGDSSSETKRLEKPEERTTKFLKVQICRAVKGTSKLDAFCRYFGQQEEILSRKLLLQS